MQNKEDKIKKVEQIIGYTFKNKTLIEKALTHSSVNPKDNYQNLEFLGDSVLGLIVSTEIYKRKLDLNEGQLTRIRAKIVSEKPLAKVVGKLKLNECLLVGTNEEKQEISKLSSIKGDLFESITGAIYLDSDLITVNKYVLEMLDETITKVINSDEIEDFKSRLLEYGSKNNINVEFVLKSQEGPAHMPTFTFDVLLNGEVFGTGSGTSKKQAQQTASKFAIRKLKIIKF